jgi:hypothetical protein
LKNNPAARQSAQCSRVPFFAPEPVCFLKEMFLPGGTKAAIPQQGKLNCGLGWGETVSFQNVSMNVIQADIIDGISISVCNKNFL